MEFSVNHPILFVMVGFIIAAVLAQSAFFLIKAWRRGKELGMDKKKLRKVATTASVFTIAPAVAIVISVLALSKKLGLALPWLRLSVVGSLSYEAIAAENTSNAMGLIGSASPNASQFVTIILVMTLSIMVGIWLVPVVCKKLQSGMVSLEKRDKKWADLFSSSMFIGMIAAFVGFVFCDVSRLWSANADGLAEVVKKVTENGEKVEKTYYYKTTSGLVPVCVMAVSAVVMIILGLLSKKNKKAAWLADYALPISLLIGMASAIPFVALFGGEVKV
ncbi:MAG: DUF5058 family protein [Ruminococcaceae bacterium]|nr:DUF5058 family protein [Oscillospiraceae bacterium]